MGFRAESMISNLQEKMKGMEGESVILMRSTQAKLKETGADEVIHNLVEKLKQLLLMLENFGSSLMAWLDKVFPPETRKEQIQHWIHACAPYVVIGFTLLVLFYCCRGCLSRCCMTAFNILKASFSCCCRSITYCGLKAYELITAPFRFCCGMSRASMRPGHVNMMIAPGTGRSFMIPRGIFEANPKGYFRGLRGGK